LSGLTAGVAGRSSTAFLCISRQDSHDEAWLGEAWLGSTFGKEHEHHLQDECFVMYCSVQNVLEWESLHLHLNFKGFCNFVLQYVKQHAVTESRR